VTTGVLLLAGEALADLLLLPFRVAVAFATASRRRREVAELVAEASRHAAQDTHPPR